MSKMVTIPENHKPFIVNINNREYIYRGGETVEVPDEVAEAIEDALELVPKPKRYLDRLAQFVEGRIDVFTEDVLEGIETVAPFAFYNRDNITSIALPHGVKSIGASAFSFCDGLTSVTIPGSIESIGGKVFTNCTNLGRVIVKALTPPTVESITFTDCPTTCVFEVPSEAVQAYKAAEYWSTVANQIKAIEE